MESATVSAGSDDREEGEIVDDDFEDISDNSIIVPIYSGKSVSPKEHLHAISLSSITEVDEPKIDNKTRHRRKVTRKKTPKSKKRKNSHRKSTCSDSESDGYTGLDRKLQKQLKAAVRVDDTEERHKNSLRSRLKGMTKLEESDHSGDKQETEKIEEKGSSDEGDSELAELRLEALRTAVLNKFKHRKKKKLKESNENDILSDASIKTDNSETNKENNHKILENCPKTVCVETLNQNKDNKLEIPNIVADSNTPFEDDEDVLRALLLASMSKKITSETEKRKPIVPLPNNGIKRTMQTINVSKDKNIIVTKTAVTKQVQIKNNIMVTKNIEFPEVKPLIINVNEDSDSEDDLFNKSSEITNNQIVPPQIDLELENTVEKFLKEQRAVVEAQLSPIPKPSVKPKNSSLILEKSAVKLLPKVKQVEYQKLLQKLKNAERKPRIRRSSFKFNSEGKPITYTSKKIVRTKLPVNKPVNSVPKVDPLEHVKNEVRTLHKILKEIQVQKNGRLQIQEKYKMLMPVIKQINEASVERKKKEEEMKRLLQKIAETKMQLAKSQQDFSMHVKHLTEQKEQIDKSTNLKKVAVSKAHFTSTPLKENPPAISFEIGSLPTITSNNTVPLSDTVIKATLEEEEEDMRDAPLNPGDPNDIDKIYSKQQNTFPKYISPLDNVKRVVTDDPFSIICPYEVDGNCRDPECIYKHLFK